MRLFASSRSVFSLSLTTLFTLEWGSFNLNQQVIMRSSFSNHHNGCYPVAAGAPVWLLSFHIVSSCAKKKARVVFLCLKYSHYLPKHIWKDIICYLFIMIISQNLNCSCWATSTLSEVAAQVPLSVLSFIISLRRLQSFRRRLRRCFAVKFQKCPAGCRTSPGVPSAWGVGRYIFIFRWTCPLTCLLIL